MPISLRRCGDRAWLLDCTGPDRVDRVYDALVHRPPTGVTEVVPAATTVLVRYDPTQVTATALATALHRTFDQPGSATAPVPSRPGDEGPGRTAIDRSGPPDARDRAVDIPVVYDGPDLQEVADLLGLTPDEVVRQHSGAAWRSDFIGFAPGFAYLSSPDLPWRLPRRATSRAAVPPGAVGLADGWTGIYPRRSPGGWQLIGRTDATLWDVTADPPALLAPGTVVRFVVVQP